MIRIEIPVSQVRVGDHLEDGRVVSKWSYETHEGERVVLTVRAYHRIDNLYRDYLVTARVGVYR